MAAVAGAVVLAVGGLAALRAVVLKGRVKPYETWGCGFAYATPRMQYTAASFADPILHIFRAVLRPRTRREEQLSGKFLVDLSHETHFHDILENGLYLPLYHLYLRLALAARRLHTGSVHLYLGYMMATVLLLLLLFR